MQAQNYFQSYEDYFWEWETTEDGLYLTIPKAKTIAHNETVLELLQALSEESIPPFGSLLLAIIATNAESDDSFHSLLYYVKRKEILIGGSYVPNTSSAMEFLSKIQELRENKKGSKRLLLFKTIFSDCHKRISSEKAKIILDDYKTDSISLEKIGFNQNNFANDFKVFELLNRKFPTAKSIVDAMKGLPTDAVEEQISEAVLDQVEVTDIPKDFISQLIQEDKTFHVGSLIKRIWSGLNIPLHHNMPSSQPLGGISDLTNKGDFDKLLLSEFAQDDDVFMSRIANNEALYIQREVPPEADQFERIILIDSTLKNWGNAKVLNFATALAIAKHPKTDIKCKLFVLGTTFSEVLYSSVDEVIDGLDILNPTLDCSVGLQDYIVSNKKETSAHELFFVTSEDSLRLESVKKTISDFPDALQYIITTNGTGEIQIYKIQNKGKKFVQKMILPLEELWLKPQSTKPLVKKPKETLVSLSYNYPLLAALPQNPIATFFLEEKYYFLSSNKSLQETYLDKTQDKYDTVNHINPATYKGSRILFENISIKSGGVYALGKNDSDQFELFYYFEKESKLCYLNVETKEFATITFGFGSKELDYKFYFLLGKYYLVHIKTNETWQAIYENESITCEQIFGNGLESDLVTYNNKIGMFWSSGNNVLKSFNRIAIDKNGALLVNIHRLDVTRPDYIFLCPDRNTQPEVTAQRETDQFVFPDGSRVRFDKVGMLTFISSDISVPEFYIPTSLQFSLGVASETEFAGNNYFYDETKEQLKITTSVFLRNYLNPFIRRIVSHGV